ncbi:MAG TPA: hypothetical protein VJ624_11480 [Thermodesulfobacteriota bacterium]|nr:hypothetical protein [Thermodesulfobacteriota bacterium]
MDIQSLQDNDYSSCFGCGPGNPQGLKIQSFWNGKEGISREDEPGAYCGMITNTTHEITCQCKDCKREWTETKVESKFE